MGELYQSCEANTPDICGDGKKQRSLLFFYFAGNHKRVITYN